MYIKREVDSVISQHIIHGSVESEKLSDLLVSTCLHAEVVSEGKPARPQRTAPTVNFSGTVISAARLDVIGCTMEVGHNYRFINI